MDNFDLEYGSGTIFRHNNVASVANMITLPLQSNYCTYVTSVTTKNFNVECKKFVDELGELSSRYNN
jgi:5'(3')-deoxyribonucleotidase